MACIILSLVICFAVTPLFNRSISEKTQIVRVVREIKKGEEITAAQVKVVEVGGYNLPEDVVRNPETAIGRYASAEICILTPPCPLQRASFQYLDGTAKLFPPENQIFCIKYLAGLP